MTFTKGTKVRYKASTPHLSGLNGIEGVVTEVKSGNTTLIKVTKGTDAGTHQHCVGAVEGFSTDALVPVEEKTVFKVGDRIRYNDPGNTTHHGLVGTITATDFGWNNNQVRVDVDEDCEAFLRNKQWNHHLDGKNWYFLISKLEPAGPAKPKVGEEIRYEQVERGQKIRVSYESKGVVHSREGIVGKVSKNKPAFGSHEHTFGVKENWTINVLDDEKERYGDKGQRLNWGSDKNKETIVLLEAAPEVDAVLERLLESKGGTVVRAFKNEFLVRDTFSDTWRNYSTQKSFSSETLRREAGEEIVFFVEDKEGI